MKSLHQLATLVTLAALASFARAQAPELVPVPFGQVFAGLAPGASPIPTQCSPDIPTDATVGTSTVNVGDGCVPTQATLLTPYSATVDSLGNVYIGDYGDYLVRVVYNGGTALAAAIVAANATNPGLVPTPGHIYTLAGSRTASLAKTGSPSKYYCNSNATGTVAVASNGDGCPATYAYIKPRTVAIDHDGNILFTSASGSAPVRVVYVGGTAMANLINILDGVTAQPGFIYSIIRSASNGYAGDGLVATMPTVQTYAPRDVAVDSNENIYFSDGTNAFTAPAYASNNNIRIVNGTTGIITTFAGAAGCAEPSTAGCAGVFGGDGGPATSATFNSPYAIFVDAYNNLYIADYNEGRLRVVYNSGPVPGLSNLTPGYVYTVIGGGATATTAAGASGSLATQLSFGSLFDAGMDPAGNIFAQDGTAKSLWRVDAKTGIASIVGDITGQAVATTGASCGTGTGLTSSDKVGSGCPATEESLSASGRLSFDTNGNFYEDESSNAVIRKFSYNTVFPATAVGATVTQPLAFVANTGTVAPAATYTTQGSTATDFAAGATTPNCVANTSVAANMTCVYSTTFAPTRAGLREGSVNYANTYQTTSYPELLSGTGIAANASVDPATPIAASGLTTPSGIAVDLGFNIYVADSSTGKVVEFPAGTPTTSGGTTVLTGLGKPAQVAVDGNGGIYVADAGNNRIAYLPAAGSVTSLGTGLKSPTGVAIDGQGDIFIADTGNNRLVEIPSIAGGALGIQFTVDTNSLAVALSAPTALAVDSTNDVYIADTGNARIVEIPAGNAAIPVNLGTTPILPVGVAVDPAGDIYIADTNSLSVLEFPAGSTLSNQLATGLKSPNGLAIDAGASILVSDSANPSIIGYIRSNPTISFNPTNVGESNIASVNVTDTGNAPLLFNGTTLTSATGNTADFSVAASSSNGCALATPIALGADCALTATFAPLAKGTLTETATLVTNAPAANAAAAVLTGNGVQLVSTTTALAITAPTTSTISYAQNVTLTATVTPASNVGTAPTGLLTFSFDGKTQPVQTLTGSTATITLTSPGVGTHVVTVSYSGDSNYASSSTSTSFTVAKATTITTVTITPSTTGGVTYLTFTAQVASPTATGATGTVTLYAGTTPLIASPLGPSGVVSVTIVDTFYSTTTSSSQFSAVYSGDANFSASTSTTLAPTPDFTVAPLASTFSIAQGGVATNSINITPLYNYTGTVSASCSGLPANSVCRFSPTTLTLSGGVTQILEILVYTNVSSTQAENHPPTTHPYSARNLVALALLIPAALWVRRRKLTPLLLALIAIGALSGCQSAGDFETPLTPTGASTITVTVSDANKNTHSQAMTLTIFGPG